MAKGLGLKTKIVKPLGKKLKKAEKVGMKTGKSTWMLADARLVMLLVKRRGF
jgi:hypothetical protein